MAAPMVNVICKVATGFLCKPLVNNFPMSIATTSALRKEVKMAKMLKRMFDKGPKKKTWYLTPAPVDQHFQTVKKKGYSDGQQRRADHVSRVLYDYVVEIVNSGELTPQSVNTVVEITKVKMIPNFSALHVHWLPTGTEQDEVTQQMLEQNAGRLRYLLTKYQALGKIPTVVFLQDKSQKQQQEVERLLREVDFGHDFCPTELGADQRSELSLEVDIESHDSKLNKAFKQMQVDRCPDVTYLGLTQNNSQETNVSDSSLTKTVASQINPKGSNSENRGNLCTNTFGEPADKSPDPPSLADVSIVTRDAQEIKHRNDIYGLDREALLQKILLSKQKTQHRGRDLPDTLTAEDFESKVKSGQNESKAWTDMFKKQKRQEMKVDIAPYTVRDFAEEAKSLADLFDKKSEDFDSLSESEEDDTDCDDNFDDGTEYHKK